MRAIPVLRLLSPVFVLALSTAPAVAQNWPSFRGEFARGVADGQDLPVSWDVATGANIRWKASIPGMAHSSPVVWGERLFLTAAVTVGEPNLVLGDEGGIDLDDDDGAEHSWRVYCLDAGTGEILWQREAYRGPPRARRHVKASQSNSTPVTDGKTVVAIFGSQGMAAFDLTGKELWRQDLGVLDPGLFGDSSSQWGYSSSPIIWQERLIVQVDRHADSFLAAYDLASGEALWRVARDEKPVWATPTIHVTPERTQLIVAGGDWDRGYDPANGRELWRFARDLEVKTPTPFVAGDLIILAGGYRGKPVYALPSGAEGEASPAWTSEPGGPYTSTPVAYGDHLHFVRNTGILTVLSLASGESSYRQRLDSTYSASPVASDGKIYLTGEEGVVRVVRAGAEFELLGESDMGEPCMATPAISGGTMFLRCRSHLYAIGRTPAASG